jgi:hypothetical protein
MKLITSLSSVIFTEFVDLTKNYESIVFSIGFRELNSRIRETIRLRWETLQRFANRTKLRLQAIRKIVNNPTLKKANVVQDHVSSLLKSYPNPVESLMSDIKHIFGGADLKACVSVAFKRNFRSELDALRFLRMEILRLYLNLVPENPSIKDLKVEKPTSEPTEIEFDTTLRVVTKLQNSLGTLRKTSIGYQTQKDFKLYVRTKNLISLFKNTIELLTQLDRIPRVSSDTGVLLATDGQFKDTSDYIAYIRGILSNERDYLLNAINLQRNYEHTQEVKNLMDTLFKILKEEDLSSSSSKKREI